MTPKQSKPTPSDSETALRDSKPTPHVSTPLPESAIKWQAPLFAAHLAAAIEADHTAALDAHRLAWRESQHSQPFYAHKDRLEASLDECRAALRQGYKDRISPEKMQELSECIDTAESRLKANDRFTGYSARSLAPHENRDAPWTDLNSWVNGERMFVSTWAMAELLKSQLDPKYTSAFEISDLKDISRLARVAAAAEEAEADEPNRTAHDFGVMA